MAFSGITTQVATELLRQFIDRSYELCRSNSGVVDGFDRSLGRSVVSMINELERDAQRPLVGELDADSRSQLIAILGETKFLARMTTARERSLAEESIKLASLPIEMADDK